LVFCPTEGYEEISFVKEKYYENYLNFDNEVSLCLKSKETEYNTLKRLI